MNQWHQEIKPGDVLQMTNTRLPSAPTFKAAVESVGDGQFAVFSHELRRYSLSPQDLVFDHGQGDFHIHSRIDAKDAVPQESGGFQWGERLRTTVLADNGKFVEGTVVAALEGLVCLITDEGEDFTARIDYLQRVE